MIQYKFYHVDGCYFEITDDGGKEREFDVEFVENTPERKILYVTKLKKGGWAKLSRKYFSDISVIVRYKGMTVKQINFLQELKGRKVLISFESKSLGDTLAWIPYCLEFQNKYQCEVVVSTFKNSLFENVYPELKFIGRGVVVHDLFGMVKLGWFWDKHQEPINPILVPLQQTACNLLSLDYQEIIPRIDFTPKESPFDGKYVAISTHSTAQLKYWYYWQELIDFLIGNGYYVVEVSSEKTSFAGTQPLEDKSLENVMNVIHHADFFIGLSSGLSWLAWALRKKVVMIANFTNANHEFQTDCIRITNTDVCHGCWHNPLFKFNKGDWNWCPEHEDTPRQFECHKSITSKMVVEKIIQEVF